MRPLLGLPLPGPDPTAIVAALRTWRERIETILALEMLDRPRVFQVELQPGINQVEHRLGRVPRGWIQVAPRGSAFVAQIEAADSSRLPLVSTANLVLTLWVW